MKTIAVKLAERSYPICVGGRLEDLGAAVQKTVRHKGFPPRRALVVAHPFLKKRYGARLASGFKKSGVELSYAIVPPGEHRKDLATVEKLYRKCVRDGLDRSSCIVALGGGVVGDMAGFAAATYLRGINVVQVPTTLLAMVDSSIGGKTGVDLPEAKNFVGAFHQPALVWIDPSVLSTLPEREFRNGMAEVIKYGVIADAKLFSLLERLAPLSPRTPQLSEVISRCAQIKASVVSKDERETRGLRETLNFGHTLGHAIETLTEYRTYKHGEAVAIGMCAAGAMAVRLKLWSIGEAKRMMELIALSGLPNELKGRLPSGELLQIMGRDKKVLSGAIRYVLPRRIGKVTVEKVDLKALLAGLDFVGAGSKPAVK